MARSFEFGAALAAALVIVGGAGNPALAQDATPDVAALPAMFATFVSAGLQDPNGKVPALDAVAGAGVHSLSLSQPTSVLLHGRAYTFVVVSSDNAFKGTCIDSYSLTRGTTVLAHGTIKSYACAANTNWDWVSGGVIIPNKPGQAKLTGTVTYGGKKVTTSTTVLIK
jgi:hypothetical protein